MGSAVFVPSSYTADMLRFSPRLGQT